MKLSKVIIISFVLYCVVYAFSLNLDYVEGDDALNIAYHALGRDPSIQPKYAEYHGMMDKVLSVLPANENIVRVTGILITAFFAWAMYILMMLIAFHLINLKSDFVKQYAIFALPLVAPEFFFIGLTYTPAVVSMSFILLSHWLLIYSRSFQNNSLYKLLFALFFGFGAAFRWDCSLYIMVIALERLTNQKISFKSVMNLFVLCSSAIVSSFLFIGISISDFETIKMLFSLRTSHTKTGGVYTVYSIGSALGNLAFFTPSFLILFLAGLKQVLLNKRYDLIIFLLFSISFIFPIFGLGIFATGTLKRIFCITPILLGVSIIGLHYFLSLGKWKKLIISSLILITITPYFIGIKVYARDSSWGPGFETQLNCKKSYNPTSTYNLEVKNKATKSEFVIGPGFAYMTEEGPRPLGGFVFVLTRDWKKFNRQWNDEKNAIVDSAIMNHIPIIQEKETAYPVAYLCRLGYSTKDPATTDKTMTLTTAKFAKRTFINSKLDTVIVINYQGDYRNDFMNLDMRNELHSKFGDSIFIHAQYSSTIRKLCGDDGTNFTAYSPFTGMIFLK